MNTARLLQRGMTDPSLERKWHKEILIHPSARKKCDFTITPSRLKASKIFCYIRDAFFFPIGIAHLTFWGIRKVVNYFTRDIALPAAHMSEKQKRELDKYRKNAPEELQDDFLIKRVCLQTADNCKIDGMVLCPKGKGLKRRWTLFSNGNLGYYEGFLDRNSPIPKIIKELKTNAFVYNYRRVGRSKGKKPTRNGILTDAATALNFVADKKRGLGATEILEFGHSLGGLINGHLFKRKLFIPGPKIKYVSVSDRTGKQASAVIKEWTGWRLADWFTRLFWQLDAYGGAKERTHPQVVIQHPQDGVIPPKASLAAALKKHPLKGKEIKIIKLHDAVHTPQVDVHSRYYKKKELRRIRHAIDTAFQIQKQPV